jgi:hypothetical protein
MRAKPYWSVVGATIMRGRPTLPGIGSLLASPRIWSDEMVVSVTDEQSTIAAFGMVAVQYLPPSV